MLYRELCLLQDQLYHCKTESIVFDHDHGNGSMSPGDYEDDVDRIETITTAISVKEEYQFPSRGSSLGFNGNVPAAISGQKVTPLSVRQFLYNLQHFGCDSDSKEYSTVKKYLQHDLKDAVTQLLQDGEHYELLTGKEASATRHERNLIALRLAELESSFHFEEKIKDGIVRMMKLYKKDKQSQVRVQGELITVLMRQNKILVALWQYCHKNTTCLKQLMEHSTGVLSVWVNKLDSEKRKEEDVRRKIGDKLGELKSCVDETRGMKLIEGPDVNDAEKKELIMVKLELKEAKDSIVRLKEKCTCLCDELERIKSRKIGQVLMEESEYKNVLLEKQQTIDSLNNEIEDLKANFDVLLKQNTMIKSYVSLTPTMTESSGSPTNISDYETSSGTSSPKKGTLSRDAPSLTQAIHEEPSRNTHLNSDELEQQLEALKLENEKLLEELQLSDKSMEELVAIIQERDQRLLELKVKMHHDQNASTASSKEISEKLDFSGQTDSESIGEFYVSREFLCKLFSIPSATDDDLGNLYKQLVMNERMLEELKIQKKADRIECLELSDKVAGLESECQRLQNAVIEQSESTVRLFQGDLEALEADLNQTQSALEESRLQLLQERTEFRMKLNKLFMAMFQDRKTPDDIGELYDLLLKKAQTNSDSSIAKKFQSLQQNLNGIVKDLETEHKNRLNDMKHKYEERLAHLEGDGAKKQINADIDLLKEQLESKNKLNLQLDSENKTLKLELQNKKESQDSSRFGTKQHNDKLKSYQNQIFDLQAELHAERAKDRTTVVNDDQEIKKLLDEQRRNLEIIYEDKIFFLQQENKRLADQLNRAK